MSCVQQGTVITSKGKEIRKKSRVRGNFLRKVVRSPPGALEDCGVAKNKTPDLESQTSREVIGTVDAVQDRSPIIEAPKSPSNDEFANVSLSDLEMLDILGTGGFGRVSLVIIRGDFTRSFALKRIQKAKIVEGNQQRHILSEKQVMTSLNSDFVVKLHKTFKDDKYMYMLMESCLGGDVFDLLERVKFLREPAARFYIACVVKAFEHLHSMNIAYRDLKTENLLIDNQGYLKVADFGFARKLDPNQRAMSMCGTTAYMAPEVALERGHDVRCDYWSLGVVIFELLTGEQAFEAIYKRPNAICGKILHGFVIGGLPKTFSNEVKALILSLCHIDPEKRLDGGDISRVETNLWFHGFDWKALTTRTMAPPSVPEIHDATDTSYFDFYSSDEEDPPADDVSGWDADF